ncbi:MAG: hypothetical protein GXP25_18140 [Planctomycetes bacterium]|nr:hypothetical protein [Planctomycetota bacterium]
MQTQDWKALTAVALLGVAVLGRAAAAQEAVARISEFSGQVAVQRGDEIIQPVLAGKLIRNASLIENDMVQTRQGTASVLFMDGSILKMREDSLVAINPPTPVVKAAAAGDRIERRVRIVVGKVWTFIEPKTASKTVFEIPDGICGVRGCAGEFAVGYNGNYRMRVDEGTFLPQDFRVGVRWEQNAGVDVGVDRVPRGIRIQNSPASREAIGLTFGQAGTFEVVADRGTIDLVDAARTARSLQEGQGGTFSLAGTAVRTLRPGCAILILLKRQNARPIGKLASLAPFPYRTSHTAPWHVAVSNERPLPGGWLTQPKYIRDERRDAWVANTRARRTPQEGGREGGKPTKEY